MKLLVWMLVGCNGSVEGDVRVTELHPTPQNSAGQWLEITQLHRTQGRSLGGLTLTVAGSEFALPDVELGAGERFVVGTSAAEDAGVPLDLIAPIDLTGTPTLTLLDGSEVIHTVQTDDAWPFMVGTSVSRDPELSDGVGAWCATWEAGEGPTDFATPGLLNGPCACELHFDFAYRSVVDPSQDVVGTESIVFHPDGSFVIPGESGSYTRSTDALGQTIEWTYANGIGFSGFRAWGADTYETQPIELPGNFSDFSGGEWSAAKSCEG